jgi:nanoRNase/pAp phosphatase (c-di-AMP/oligoRNAs hydrolase)
MIQTRTRTTTPSERLLRAVADFERLLIVAHDNPDPDAIASGWALYTLFRAKTGKPVRLVGGGAIVRAENRHMVELLSPPLELIDDIQDEPGTGTILVDCSSTSSNHVLARGCIKPVAVVDHHFNPEALPDVAFADLRPNIAATASLAAQYLREQGIPLGAKLATALLYAIRTETRGSEFRFSPLDREILPWLTEFAEPELLAEIESAPLSRAYFRDLVLAMQGTTIYGDVAICLLPRAEGAETVGEVADLLIRCRGVRCVLCGAVIGGDLIVSARTTQDADNAAELIGRTLAGIGNSGGHDRRAGGKLPQVARIDSRVSPELQETLRQRWLQACGTSSLTVGVPLIARREIMEHL